MTDDKALLSALNVIRKLVERIEELQDNPPCPEGFVLIGVEEYNTLERRISELERESVRLQEELS